MYIEPCTKVVAMDVVSMLATSGPNAAKSHNATTSDDVLSNKNNAGRSLWDEWD